MRAKSSPGIMLIALAATLLGVVLLLNNFYLLAGFNVVALLPLLLVVAGAVILLRGDLLGSGQGRTFGITRGSVEAGTVEVSSGAVDVRLAALPREGRLIAGQFAAESRPQLVVQEGSASLRFSREATPFLALSDWELALARDLPWMVRVSTSLGNVEADLRGLLVQGGLIATGLGDIRLTCPTEAFAPIALQSTLGHVLVLAPDGVNAEIVVKGGRMFRVHVDENRYVRDGNIYRTQHGEQNAGVVQIQVSGTFGDAFLA